MGIGLPMKKGNSSIVDAGDHQVIIRRALKALPGTQIKDRVVQRANNVISTKVTVVQPPLAMRALDRNAELLAFDFHHERHCRIICRLSGTPSGVHRFTSLWFG